MFYKIIILVILCTASLIAMDQAESFQFQDLPKDLKDLVLAHAYKDHATLKEALQQFKTLTLVSKDAAQVAKNSGYTQSLMQDLLNKYDSDAIDVVICLSSDQALIAFKQQFNESFMKLCEHIKTLTNTITSIEIEPLLNALSVLENLSSESEFADLEFKCMATFTLRLLKVGGVEDAVSNWIRKPTLQNKSKNFLWRIIERHLTDFAKLALNANPDTKNSIGLTYLMRTVHYGDIYFIKVLLAADAQINLFDDLRQVTALMAGIRAGQENSVKLLLVAGADPNLQNIHGQTALYMAAFATNLPDTTKRRLVNTLLEHGASTLGMNMAEQCKFYWSYILPKKAQASACTIV